MKFLITLLTAALLALSGLHSAKAREQSAMQVWLPKVLAGSLSPYLAFVSVAAGWLAWLARAPLAGVLAGLAAFLHGRYVWRIAQSPADFGRAFGPDWRGRISAEQESRMLPSTLAIPLTGLDKPTCGNQARPCVQRDLAFWTIPGASRQLLCDVWQPPAGTRPSGLAIIYFHGSGWHVLDKDYGTGPFFEHLAAQGHVVMDVAYRLCPETDIFGMMGDVKRSIAWLKRHAERYGVDPDRIVLAGGSAGGHLALLAAYAPDDLRFVPGDLDGADTSVRAVVSYYGPCDLRAFQENYAWWKAQPTSGGNGASRPDADPAALANPKPIRSFEEVGKVMSGLGGGRMVGDLLGGSPDEVPELYDLASPISHVGPHCPPTLLIQGAHDTFVPVQPTRLLHQKLIEAGVPVVHVELPDTEHAFDLFLPKSSPSTRAATYYLDRFLALM